MTGMITQLKIKVIILSILHLLVDGICAYTVFNKLYPFANEIISIVIFLGYNILAFVTQPFVGMVLDKFNIKKKALSISLVMLIIGAIINFPWYISLILIGCANSIFHVVGGKYTVELSDKKLSYLGLFVSLGATGLAIGTNLWQEIVLQIFVILTIVLGVICHLLKDYEQKEFGNINKTKIDIKVKLNLKEVAIIVILLSIIVGLRSMIGLVSIPLFTTTLISVIGIGIATSFGKILGGILADTIGIKWTVLITLPLSLIGFSLFRDNLIIYIISIILFNTTMPITLFLSNKMLPNKEGLSFGILAASLFPGYLFGNLYTYLDLSYIPLLCASILLSIIIILYSYKKVKQ